MVLAATGALAGLGSTLLATAQPAWAFTAGVQIVGDTPKDFDFNPRSTPIFVGDRIQWTNDTPVRHTVTSDPGSPATFDSGEIMPNNKPGYERRFTQPGTYAYHCKIHDDMKGVIEVTDPNAPTTTTTTAPPPTTTTTAAPPTTTTTAPTTTTTEPPTTTTTAFRPPAAVEPPPVPATAAAPPPTRATSSTTTVPSSTTTTAPPPTTATSSPPPTAGDQAAPPGTVPPAPPSTEVPKPDDTGDEIPAAAGPSSSRGDKTDPATVALVSALVAVGLFGSWTLIRVRPGRI